jgi:ligand-binding sensor domain-containing protein
MWLSMPLHAEDTGFFYRYTEKDGLSNNRVTCFLQDSLGFIWIGTQFGLNRFDGIRFKTYLAKEGDTNSISSNGINALALDRKGNIWIGTETGGLCMIPFGQNKIKQVSTGGSLTLPDVTILSLYFDNFDRLWIGYKLAGWSCLNTQTWEITHGKPPHRFLNYWGENASHSITGFTALNGSDMFMTTGHGAFVYNKASKKYLTIIDTSGKYSFDNENAFLATQVSHKPGHLLLPTWGCGVKELQLSQKKFVSHTYAKQHAGSAFTNIVKAMLTKSQTEYWIASADKGLGIFNSQTGQFSFYSHQPEDIHSVLSTGCHTLMTDRQGTLWAGFENGLVTWSPQLQRINTLQPSANGPENASYMVYPMYFDAAAYQLYCGRDFSNGVFRYNITTKQEAFFPFPKTMLNAQGYNRILQLHPLANGQLLLQTNKGWFTWQQGTTRYAAIELEFEGEKIIPRGSSTQPNARGLCYFEDTRDFYYSIHLPTLSVKRIAGSTITEVKAPWPLGPYSFGMLPESDSILWANDRDRGLVRLNTFNNMYDSVYLAEDPYKLTDAKAMVKDSRQNYWVTLYARGLYKLEPRKQNKYAASHNTDKDNMRTIFTGDMAIDSTDRLWIMSHKGLVTVSTHTMRFQYIDDADGFKEHWYENSNPILLHPDGKLFFGHRAGVSFLNVYGFQTNKQPPPVVFTDCRILNTSIYDSAFVMGRHGLQLQHWQNYIEFSFAALSYINPGKNQFAYRLEGYQEEWRTTDKEPGITFAALSPGKYRLQVKAANNDGVWNEEGAVFAFEILEPVWKRPWFLALLLAAVVGASYYFYQIKMKVVRRQEALKTSFIRQLSQVEMKALRAQMNPHFIFNSLNSINRYIVKSDPETASGYLTRFAKLIRLILNNSASETTTLANELELLKIYIEMEQLRFENRFEVMVHIDPAIHPDTTEIPSLLIQPYVENAIWHGLLHKKESGKLELSIQQLSEKKLLITVKDDGIGRQKAGELKSRETLNNKSMGIEITGERMRAVKELYGIEASATITDLTNDEGLPCGTQVEITLPFQQITNI